MSKVPSMQDLLEAGVHFGHQVRRWNPKMKQYIFAARDGVHVIDLGQTVPKLEEAVDFVEKIGEAGGTIIFLGSKKQARPIVLEEANKAGSMHITERWIGGLLTNFEQTSKSLKKLKELKEKKAAGEFKDRTKKEQLLIDREIAKLTRFYGGVEELSKLPDAIFIIDVKREENACREAKNKSVPVVAICDTNADLTLVDYPIPGNDDAIKSIAIITAAIADAYKGGREKFEKKSAQQKVALAGESAAQIAKEGSDKGQTLTQAESSEKNLILAENKAEKATNDKGSTTSGKKSKSKETKDANKN